MDGPIWPTPSFLLQLPLISVRSVQPHAKTQNIFLESMEISLDADQEAVPGPHPWENTLRCLRERQVPSKKNIWQDWERVVGLSGRVGCPRSYTYRMF